MQSAKHSKDFHFVEVLKFILNSLFIINEEVRYIVKPLGLQLVNKIVVVKTISVTVHVCTAVDPKDSKINNNVYSWISDPR